MGLLREEHHTPPINWVETDPDWYRPGMNLTVSVDGDEPGRVCGEVQPPPGSTKFAGGGVHQGKPIPAVYPDETFADFHAGAMPFTTDSGETRQVPVGTMALFGGHSMNVQAANLEEGRDWLQRRGRWAGLEDELVAYGKISRVDSGPRKGALIFRGSVYPWTTSDEAAVVNSTTVSGETWPHPDFGGAYQFIGPARVRQTSFKYNMPEALAASLDSYGDEGPAIIPCTATDTALAAAPIMAEYDEGDMAEMRRLIEDLQKQVSEADQNAATILAHVMDSSTLSHDQEMEDIRNRLSSLEEAIERLQDALNQKDEPPEAANTNSGQTPQVPGQLALA